jgi:hypothetical protein
LSTRDVSPDPLLDTALARLRRRASLARGGAVVLGATQLAGCDLPTDQAEGIAALADESWSTDEGQRNTAMVSYLGGYWTKCTFPNTRFGCGAYETFVKVRVKPVAGVDLNWKKVGISYRAPWETYERTAVGYYYTTYGNGDEEWHVPVNQSLSPSPFLFDVWYQTGGGKTYVDDNQGELHVVNPGQATSVVRSEPWLASVTVGPEGVKGSINVQIADLDYDKEVVLLCTTDDWQTVMELGTGNSGETNKFYWVEDFQWGGSERWRIDLDLPGPVERLRYAIAYRHGVKNDAVRYEFWDNNWGQDYVVEAPPVIE